MLFLFKCANRFYSSFLLLFLLFFDVTNAHLFLTIETPRDEHDTIRDTQYRFFSLLFFISIESLLSSCISLFALRSVAQSSKVNNLLFFSAYFFSITNNEYGLFFISIRNYARWDDIVSMFFDDFFRFYFRIFISCSLISSRCAIIFSDSVLLFFSLLRCFRWRKWTKSERKEWSVSIRMSTTAINGFDVVQTKCFAIIFFLFFVCVQHLAS